MAYVIAHRANGSKYLENTQEAVLFALEKEQVDGIELDVRMTKDKVFVLSHNGIIICENKSIKAISACFYDQIKNCKKVDRLENILKEIQTKKKIVLDLKIDNNKKIYLKHLMKLLSQYPNNYYLCSFNYEAMLFLKKKYPNYKVGYLKGYYLNENKEKGILDFCFSHEKTYQNEEGIWTINQKEIFLKYKKKEVFIITDHPEFNT